jgi:N-acetyl-anhydromuramyl-L-alanine amidase AmpD
VRRNGYVVPILPESVQGVHAVGYNHCSIAVCYEGGLDENGNAADTRTELQKASLYELLKQLRRDYPQARIIGHRELPNVRKDCPCFSCAEYADLQP